MLITPKLYTRMHISHHHAFRWHFVAAHCRDGRQWQSFYAMTGLCFNSSEISLLCAASPLSHYSSIIKRSKPGTLPLIGKSLTLLCFAIFGLNGKSLRVTISCDIFVHWHEPISLTDTQVWSQSRVRRFCESWYCENSFAHQMQLASSSLYHNELWFPHDTQYCSWLGTLCSAQCTMHYALCSRCHN